MDNDYRAKQEIINNSRFQSDVYQKLQNFKELINNFEIILNDIKNNIDNLKVKVSYDLENHEIASKNMIKIHQNLIDSFKIDMKENEEKHNKLIDRMLNIFVHKDFLDEKLSKINSSFKDNKKEIDFLSNQTKDLVNNLKINFDNRIEELRRLIPSVESDEVISKRDEKIHVLSMDVTNSAVRSLNCEKQLNLIDKKLESINLFLKKLNLN